MIKEPMRRTKICHVTSAHPRYDVRIFHKECRSLVKHGYDVTLLVNDSLPNESRDGVKIVSTQFEPKNRLQRMIKTKRHFGRRMLEIDASIYHFHDPELLLEAAWMKRQGKTVIFDFHEDVSQQILHKSWIPREIRKVVSFFYGRYEERVAARLDALVTVTPKFVERLKQINLNTYMITNYPIKRRNSHSPIYEKKRAICFAGKISPQWNHESIIRAIESIDDIEYIMAGRGRHEYIESLRQLKGWSKVRYLGEIPHERVTEVYNESMVGMSLLSHNTQVGTEGTLGNTKIFEFMDAGLPVISSDNKLWKELLEANKCGIAVNPSNREGIIESVTRLLNNPRLSVSMGRNGQNAIDKLYNWTTQEAILLDLYNTVQRARCNNV